MCNQKIFFNSKGKAASTRPKKEREKLRKTIFTGIYNEIVQNIGCRCTIYFLYLFSIFPSSIIVVVYMQRIHRHVMFINFQCIVTQLLQLCI